jgi:dTDP-4-dehydrorhamnose reductase
MRVLVTGAAGRLGRSMVGEFGQAGHVVVGLNHAALDVTNPGAVASAVFAHRPDVIANCSSFSAVDLAETAQEDAFGVNATGPAILADIARQIGIALIHYSTDSVFDGESSAPCTETDRVRPRNVFGASKLAGERHVATAPVHYVIRLGSVFGGELDGQVHPATIDGLVNALATGQPVQGFVDGILSPTYLLDVASATRMLLTSHAPSGTYHCVNTGYCTWPELASAIAAQLRVPVSMPLAYYTDRHPRPHGNPLSSAKLASQGILMPHWHSALRRYLQSPVVQGWRSSGVEPRSVQAAITTTPGAQVL